MTLTSSTKIDTTVRIFDSFYNTELTVNAVDWDVVYSYFKGTATDAKIANNMATLFFRIAQEGNFDVLDLLATIKGTDTKLQMNQVLCYYLNTFRARYSMYGIGVIPKPNQSVQRNILM